MVAFNHNYRNALSDSRAGRSPAVHELGERIERYFRVHPQASREAFLLHAVWRELADRQRQDQATHEAKVDEAQLRRCEEIVDQCALVAMRLAELNYQRHGLWPRVRRFFSHDPAEE